MKFKPGMRVMVKDALGGHTDGEGELIRICREKPYVGMWVVAIDGTTIWASEDRLTPVSEYVYKRSK